MRSIGAAPLSPGSAGFLSAETGAVGKSHRADVGEWAARGITDPIIDLHTHWFGPSTVEIMGNRSAEPRFETKDGKTVMRRNDGRLRPVFPLGEQWFDVDARLAHLDASGVQHQLISWPTTLELDAVLDHRESAPLWSAWNDDVADLVRRHPDRFSAIAALSTSDLDWSIKELERAHEKLGLIGAVLPVNGFFSPETARQFAPLLEAAQHYRSHIYLHTGNANPAITGQPIAVAHSDNTAIRWVLDNAWYFASAVTTLAFTDFLRPYPDITIQVAMLGGSGLAAMVAEQATISPLAGVTDLHEPFRQIWLDTGAAGSGTAAIAAAVRVLGSDRIVFGTDFGPVPAIPPVVDRVRAAVVDQADASAVLNTNARALLARHGVHVPLPDFSHGVRS